jgi:hypothetical protein
MAPVTLNTRGLQTWIALVAATSFSFPYGAADCAASPGACAAGLRLDARSALYGDSAAAGLSALYGGKTPRISQLRLRGGGEMVHPTVWWSQRSASLLIKVDMPAGVHEAKGLTLEGKKLVWKTETIQLEHELHDEVDSNTVRVMNDG